MSDGRDCEPNQQSHVNSSSLDFSEIKCKFCGQVFGQNNNRYRHERSCKLSGNNVKFACNICNVEYRRKDYLIAHAKKCHQPHSSASISKPLEDSQGIESSQSSSKLSKTPCMVENCDLKFFLKGSLINHLRSSHQDDIQIQDPILKAFNSLGEFHAWKDSEEERTFSFFSQKCGQHSRKVKYFYCQHDGKSYYNPLTSRRNKKGRIKVGKHCIAKMKVWEDEEGKIHVNYFPTHSHVCIPEDFVHHPLSSSTSSYIDQQLSWGISPSEIQGNLTSKEVPKSSDVPQQASKNAVLLTKKRLRERARKFKNVEGLNEIETEAIHMLATQLAEDEQESVILYKPYKSKVVYGSTAIDDLPNSEDLFMVGLQTKRQAELMVENCHRILIVDETHKTNRHGYQLLTVMITDEKNRGWAVGHLITSECDEITLQYFFQMLNTRLPENSEINCVITDDCPALINGMNAGFSTNLRHILCQSHILKRLKENLKQNVHLDLVNNMFDEIKAIVEATTEDVFSKLLEEFVCKYENNENARDFIDYFLENYLDRSEKWAMCYRNFPHGNVNTTDHVEDFHSKMKEWYFKSKGNRRVDDLINILLQMEWDDHCTRYNELMGSVKEHQKVLQTHKRSLLTKDEDRKVLETHKRCLLIKDEDLKVLQKHKRSSLTKDEDMKVLQTHKRSLLIKDEDVNHISGTIWEIMSSEKNGQTYMITQNNKQCSSVECILKCPELSCGRLCPHMYCCSCTAENSMCEHIHKLQSFVMRSGGVNDSQTSESEESNTVLVEPYKNEEGNNEQASDTLMLQLAENLSFLTNFLSSVDNNNPPTDFLLHANGVISDLCLKVKEDGLDCNKNEQSGNFEPNQFLEIQVSPIASPLKRPSNKQKRKSKFLPCKKKCDVRE